MKIMHIAQCPLSAGIGSYFDEILPYQVDRFGAANISFVVAAGQSDRIPALIPRSQIVEFSGHGRSLRALSSFAVTSALAIRQFQPGLVHLHSKLAGAIIRPIVKLSRQPAAVVYCPHGWAFAMDVSKIRRVLYRHCERSLASMADVIVNISHSDRKDALAAGLPEERMITVRNGISRRDLVFDDSPSASEIRLLFIGRHDRQKGLDILLNTFARAQPANTRLDIIGSPVLDQGRTSPMVDMDGVRFHGWTARNDVFAMIAKSDAVIVPSRWEGFGLVALEAMQAGKAVIASRRGALQEIVEHQNTGLLFDLEDSRSLIGLLCSLSKESLLAMGREGRKKFEQEFDSARMNRELESAYSAALSARAMRIAPVRASVGVKSKRNA